MKIYKRFLDGMPEYLARYYWWAYLWQKSVWFFDHQPIINAILFGQYKKLMQLTMQQLEHTDHTRVLQLTCVYGMLTPKLIEKIKPSPLHITDVAPVQLRLAASKAAPASSLIKTRMNAEYLGYKDNSFTTTILFFLLHELPIEARENVLSETMRTLSDGGTLLLTEYAELPKKHFLYWFFPTRWITTKLEPFLNDFWHENLTKKLNIQAAKHGKQASLISHTDIFSKFYRVTTYKINKR
ncbi:methyltransferase domain-containing protein [Ghiorsea bivora]|uniref:methyltransferase domain-containing protein n=1 Tax=Ghiorsea bivora TaxID=1485545 RepID=UPI0005708455|nr:methyltransferase domain-containing protein [Ghiorsea bivora]